MPLIWFIIISSSSHLFIIFYAKYISLFQDFSYYQRIYLVLVLVCYSQAYKFMLLGLFVVRITVSFSSEYYYGFSKINHMPQFPTHLFLTLSDSYALLLLFIVVLFLNKSLDLYHLKNLKSLYLFLHKR